MNLRGVFERVFSLEVVIAFIVIAIVFSLFTFAVVHYRAGRGHEPSRTTEHHVLERSYAVVLALIAAFLVAYTAVENTAERRSLGTPQVRVRVVAYRWCWRFVYLDTGVQVDGTCLSQSSDPTLVLPTHKRIRVSVTSEDVVHEWWTPALRFKIGAYPDHTNRFDLELSGPGTYPGRCAQFCGLRHDDMDFTLRAVSPRDFSAFLHAHKPARSTAA